MLLVASKLGISSFGGPAAHIGYFRREYVERRRWLDERTFAELVAICQFLPGPASSELGIAIGLLRAGPLGAVAAWLGFTFPSFVLLVAFAILFDRLPFEAGWVFAILELVALVVVARAVWSLARALAPDLPRRLIALAAAAAVLAAPHPAVQVGVIAVAAIVGWRALPAVGAPLLVSTSVPIGRGVATACLLLYVGLLVLLPLARAALPDSGLALADPFYRAGSLVFGGGHVVLPLLRAEIPATVVSDQRFVAGYGAAQLVPGPLFTFAAYLGAVIVDGDPLTAIGAALVATLAIFLPAFLLVFAALPSWGALRAYPSAQSALRGVNAAVVGLLLAALVNIVRAIASALI
ncbi:MAG: chromate efflux transporter [Chloroflexi bacterium]|nr:MAG: chromate efflux transporter [Chloroflexota bacterium]